MADEDEVYKAEKFERSKRLHDEETKIKRQAKMAKTAGYDIKEPHRFHKRKALNCGNSDCFLCMNPRKATGEKTIQEKKFEQREKITGELDELA